MNWTKWCLIAVAVSALVVDLGSGPTRADCNGKILHEDKFDKLDPAWNANVKNVSIDSNKLVVKPEVNSGHTLQSQTNFYQDVHICVSANVSESSDLNGTALGIVFWGVDFSNYYLFEINSGSAGKAYYQVARKVKDRWLKPVGWTETTALKLGTNQWNQLEVDIKSNTATMFINGTQVQQFSGQPPEGGGLAGLRGESPEKSVATLQFQDFKISQ